MDTYDLEDIDLLCVLDAKSQKQNDSFFSFDNKVFIGIIIVVVFIK